MFMAIIKKHTVTMLEESAAAGVRTELSMDELLVRFQSRLKQDLAKLPQHYSLLDCDASCPCLYLRDPAERAQAKASAFEQEVDAADLDGVCPAEDLTLLPTQLFDDSDEKTSQEQAGTVPRGAVELSGTTTHSFSSSSSSCSSASASGASPASSSAESGHAVKVGRPLTEAAPSASSSSSIQDCALDPFDSFLAFETGDEDVDVGADDVSFLDYREHKVGSKKASKKWFYDPTSKADLAQYTKLCELFHKLSLNARLYAHPFNTCAVERFHCERIANC